MITFSFSLSILLTSYVNLLVLMWIAKMTSLFFFLLSKKNCTGQIKQAGETLFKIIVIWE